MRGSIIQRGKSKTYTVIFDCGRDEKNGKRLQKTKGGFKKKADAEKYLNEMLSQVGRDEFVFEKKYFDEFCDEFLEVYARPKLAPKTYISYESIITSYFKSCFGHTEMSKIKAKSIEKYYNKLRSRTKKAIDDDGNEITIPDPLSDTTIAYHHRVLNLIFKQAYKWQYIHKNPCDFIESPKKSHKDMNVWTLNDINTALKYFKDSPIYMHVFLAINTGLRLGEICGLRWEDIDFKKKIVTVKRTQQRIKKELIFKETKTVKSNRQVVVNDDVKKYLKKVYKSQLANENRKTEEYNFGYDGYISIWPDGKLKDMEYVSRRFHISMRQQSKLPIIRFHDLRHTHATLLLAAGNDLKIISERLGHTQISTTADIYTHVNIEMQKKALEKLSNLMNPIKEKC